MDKSRAVIGIAGCVGATGADCSASFASTKAAARTTAIASRRGNCAARCADGATTVPACTNSDPTGARLGCDTTCQVASRSIAASCGNCNVNCGDNEFGVPACAGAPAGSGVTNGTGPGRKGSGTAGIAAAADCRLGCGTPRDGVSLGPRGKNCAAS